MTQIIFHLELLSNHVLPCNSTVFFFFKGILSYLFSNASLNLISLSISSCNFVNNEIHKDDWLMKYCQPPARMLSCRYFVKFTIMFYVQFYTCVYFHIWFIVFTFFIFYFYLYLLLFLFTFNITFTFTFEFICSCLFLYLLPLPILLLFTVTV